MIRRIKKEEKKRRTTNEPKKKEKKERDTADTERSQWMNAWRGVERKVNKLLVSLDSSVETQGGGLERAMRRRREEREEEEKGGGEGVSWGFNSSPLRPVGLPGYQTALSWWWDAGVRS